MKAIIALPILILALLAIAGGIVLSAKISFKNKPSNNIMLLGISIILVGGILAVDPDANFGGIEYLVVFLGLAFTLGGFAKKDNI
jgi:hypothetical protein